MIIGATKETDYHIVTVAEALYHNYDLKRVFYSAFVNVNHDEALPAQPDGKRCTALTRTPPVPGRLADAILWFSFR